MIIKYTTKKGKTTELNGVPGKETEKAMLVTFTSNKNTLEKWLPKSQFKQVIYIYIQKPNSTLKNRIDNEGGEEN